MDEQQKKALLDAIYDHQHARNAAEEARKVETKASTKLYELANELRKIVAVGRITPRKAYSLGDGFIILFEYTPPEARTAAAEIVTAMRENTKVTIIDGDGKERSL